MTTKSLDFLKEFTKESMKMENVALESKAPSFWIDTGNYILNKIISGSYKRGFPQGRLALLGGFSATGKSYLAANAVKAALNQGIGVLVVDSENALDEGFLTSVGADVVDNPLYQYRGVNTISDAVKIVSSFTKNYRKSGSNHPFLIVVDSLDMLETDSENEQYESGIIKGDQGQHAKQVKAMLKRFVNDLKSVDMAMICTKQLYQNQDPISAKRTPGKLTESTKFAFSQIAIISKLLLKDEETGEFSGIKLKLFGDKTRFTKPFQVGTIEVPYETGMDPYTGVLEAAESLGVVTKEGYSFLFGDIKFKKNEFDKYKEQILDALEAMSDSSVLKVKIEEDEDMDDVPTEDDIIKKRGKRSKPE